MLLYYNFWMFMGFILHIYIVFGTNLLTGGPAQNVVFLPISVFQRKGISNGVQTEWNLRESYFWNKRDPEDLECKPRSSRGGHKGAGRAHPYRARPQPRGPTVALLHLFLHPHTPSSSHKHHYLAQARVLAHFAVIFDLLAQSTSQKTALGDCSLVCDSSISTISFFLVLYSLQICAA